MQEMIEIYIIIGSILLIQGLLLTVYFIYYSTVTKTMESSIMWASEALAIIFIGVFYLYCASTISTPTITSNIDANDTSANSEITTLQNNTEEVNENLSRIQEDLMKQNVFNKLKWMPHRDNLGENGDSELNKNIETSSGDFLKQYQHLIKTFTEHHRLRNSKKTIEPFNYRKNKSSDFKIKVSKRNNETINSNNTTISNNCHDQIFFQQAVILISFIYCALSLLIYVRECNRKCVLQEFSSDKSTDTVQVNSAERNHNLADILTTRKDNFRENPNRSNTENVKTNTLNQGLLYKCVFGITFWIIPIFFLGFLYAILFYPFQTSNYSHVNDFNNGLLALLTPINISNRENHNTEVNGIVKTIYEIVNTTQEMIKLRKAEDLNINMSFTNMDNDSQLLHNCFPVNNMSLKIHTVIAFIIYIIVIFCAAIKRTALMSRNKTMGKRMNIYNTLFATLWMPSILELFCRVYIMEKIENNLYSDVCLLIGNLNCMMINVNNLVRARRKIKESNAIQPKV